MSGETAQQEEARATGRDVILAIGETMLKGLEPLLSKTLAPSLYQVYLHPKDYDRLRTVFRRLEEEARVHLQREMARLAREAVPVKNKVLSRVESKLPKWLKAKPDEVMRYEPAEGGFYVRFEEDPSGELEPGEVMVTADLAVGDEPEYASGSKTHRISTTRRLGKAASAQQAVADEVPALATFSFSDDRGPRTFAMVRDEIVIGRRAPDRWVDLHLETAFDVSREHARVRHSGGAFQIKDLSKLGTSVNGKPVPPSLETVDGKTQDTDRWVDLPHGAVIELAAMVRLTFLKAAV